MMAAGESMHSIARQGHIRRVDHSKASGNWGFVFINCFRRHSFLESLSHSLPLSLSIIQTLLTSGLKDKYVADCCYHFFLSETFCLKIIRRNVFSLPVWYLLLELTGLIFLRSREAKAVWLPWFLRETDWLASSLISSNHKTWLKMINHLWWWSDPDDRGSNSDNGWGSCGAAPLLAHLWSPEIPGGTKRL